MTQKTEKKAAPGLRRVVAVEDGVVVNRPARQSIGGVAFIAQRCRLILDEPDAAGNQSYACKIADASDTGLGVVCRVAEQTPGLFQLGAQMTLEAVDGKRVRVEIRWIKGSRLGLQRFGPSRR